MSSNFDLILAGAGHAHLGVLRLWANGKRPAGRIGLISPDPHAWYSGMLPGLLAGRYQAEQCRIALEPLCRAAGIEFIEGAITSLDAASRTLHLANAQALQAQWLSLNLGSRPKPPVTADKEMEQLAVKPFAGFIARWNQWQQQPQRLAILGGGAAGVELALAMAGQVPSLALISATQILAGHAPALRRRALKHLHKAAVQVIERCPVERIEHASLIARGQVVWQGPRLILATGASPLAWLNDSGLACDEKGFIQISPTLQSVSHPQVFATGDCASLVDTPRNGVYAVRQGPVLASNLAHALQDEPLRLYAPQRTALALLADGQGGGMLSLAGLTLEGSLIGRWKDYLDQRFMTRHRINNP